MSIKIKFKKLRDGAIIPKFTTKGSVCFDLYALSVGPKGGIKTVFLDPGARHLVGTGLACEIPEGYEMVVRPRSGLAWRKGLTIVNSPATIDSDYRGEIIVILQNTGSEVIRIEKGDRIAQGAVRVVPEIEIIEVDELSVTERGTGGFGSTGV